ncbi:MAG: alpha-hydroxy acid oxidase [Thermoplasmata archaeon]
MTDEKLPGGFRTLSELRDVAESRLSPEVWAYVEGGAGEEHTVRENHAAFHRWQLRPRHLAGIRAVDLHTALLGVPVTSPVYVSPTAYQGLVEASGEGATARAASAAGMLAIFSTLSSMSLEDIATAAPAGPRWFQLYLQPDFQVTRELVERAEKAHYTAIVLTIDAPVLGPRDRQTRDGVAIRSPVPIGNGAHVVPPARAPELKDGVYEFPTDATATWEILTRLREIVRLPIVVKGVLTGEDARRAVDGGAHAVVVSNHGGRQLDGAITGLDALTEVVAAVGDHAEVYVDGGVRRGSDVLKALALGAKGVGIGRPVLWALAAGGEAGVARLFTLLNAELAVSMMLAGRRALPEIDRSLVSARPF